MSSVGQAIGGLVGGAIGFFTPLGPLYGAQIGMSIGGLLDPPKTKGPRLEDLSVQTSTYGAFIPRVYGGAAVTGNIFWVQNDKLIEQESVTSGKGGPELTSYKYYASFAVGLCEGPIAGVRRIWIAGQLWYDAGEDNIQAIIASNEKNDQFTVYLGTDTQEADPLIQADKGVADTPAYRGIAYILFNLLPLEKYGNSLMGAQVKVEVVTASSQTFVYQEVVAASSEEYFCGAVGRDMVLVMPYGANYLRSYDGESFELLPISSGNRTNLIFEDGLFLATRDSGSLIDISADGTSWSTSTLPSSGEWRGLAYGNGVYVANKRNSSAGAYSTDGQDWYAMTMPSAASWQRISFNGNVFCAIADDPTDVFATSPDGVTWTEVTLSESRSWYGITAKDGVFCAVAYTGSGSARAAVSNDDGATWTVANLGTAPQYRAVIAGDRYFCTATWNGDKAAFSEDGVTWTELEISTSNRFWNPVAAIGDLFYIANYSATGSDLILARPDHAYQSVTLASIVSAECLKSNLIEAADIDVTDLTDQVRGYRVSQLGPLRGGIDPLRKVWPFDVRQHGYKIEFVRRGGSSVATIPADDLDAREAGQSPGVSITDVREMDLVLPQKVVVNYLDTDREYDINSQSDERTSTDAVGQFEIELPVVLTADEGKQSATMLLYQGWLDRYDVSFVLPPTWSELEPADVVTVTADNATYSLRLTSVNYLPDGRLECRAKYNDAAIYTQSSVADTGSAAVPTLSLLGPTEYVLMDIPLLHDAYDTPGFSVVLGGKTTGWPGGLLYQSTDAGASWTNLLGSFYPGATIGRCTNSLSSHGGTVYDFTSVLNVSLAPGHTLASVTEAQLFAGQNWFAYGAHGRWEIIAARTATLQGDGSYSLQDFLRGQLGTEWATGTHAVSDTLVLLDENFIEFRALNSGAIGVEVLYRGITIGRTLETDINRAFTYAGVNLECLSPVNLTGNRNPTSNKWTLYWNRRSRYAYWRDYIDTPLGEASESYEVDVFSDGTYTTLKRTLTSTTETVEYSSANQVTDFGSNQSTLYVKIYQLSATVGRGYPLTTSITRA